ncbi:hypothetical protein Mgra_00008435 [Meloidogyne graminicola]|uniref:MAM domain-containing protein n=1 Tax=Meloidogyne graminicola TaxID=189291 RepID=A0A8S9ZFW9_9BILA|nr:hypothetical protein Mgra_00008435 [Meloidogyne graminicola]
MNKKRRQVWRYPYYTEAALFLLQWTAQALSCISSVPRQMSPAAFSASTFQAGGGSSGGGSSSANAAAAARGAPNLPLTPIGTKGEPPIGHSVQALLGNKVGLAEFGSEGYNSQGGGPVVDGESLSCNFEGEPCCWANIPTPSDDQIDWYLVQGIPESIYLRNISMKGRYLFAYAKGAGPSDEAQFSSCSITCSSSPIRVRAKHWQSNNVLLQVCQRESFPVTLGFNPLLNCQEFPSTGNVAYTELILPKASYIDIVFVASNFIDETIGDIAFLDDIEIIYERKSPDCGNSPIETTTQKLIIKSSKILKITKEIINTTPIIIESEKNERKFEENLKPEIIESEHLNELTVGSAASSSSSSSAIIISEKGKGILLEQQKPFPLLEQIENNNAKAHGVIAKNGDEIIISHSSSLDSSVCQSIKCSFEEEGSYYAAVFLYPREKAGLWTFIGNSENNNLNMLKEPTRIRFQYYEGTHGVQLKGCCNLNLINKEINKEGEEGEEIENSKLLDCPFLSDKFVSVSDRMWKWGTFVCPQGTRKIIFLCENTRTNQGACALDDIAVVENREDINMNDRPVC